MDHVHAHDHSHAHEHAHDHQHHHHGHGHGHGAGEYYLEQLLTIGISGAFALVAVMMYTNDRLRFILVPQFHPWVLWGGIVLFALTLVRIIALWRATAPKHHHHAHGPDCNHGHEHGPGCDHGHGHEHAHAGHDHEHGGIFWRVVVLMFPIALFFMGLPNAGYSQDSINERLGPNAQLDKSRVVEAKGGDVIPMTFAEINTSAMDPETRKAYEGNRVRVKGQIKLTTDKECTLYYLKMTCCAADMIPLKAEIISDDSLGTIANGDWREITGVLQFEKSKDKGQYIPVIRTKARFITPAKPEY
jgi:uncharacterized repeat protein (TIGR03943 family)